MRATHHFHLSVHLPRVHVKGSGDFFTQWHHIQITEITNRLLTLPYLCEFCLKVQSTPPIAITVNVIIRVMLSLLSSSGEAYTTSNTKNYIYCNQCFGFCYRFSFLLYSSLNYFYFSPPLTILHFFRRFIYCFPFDLRLYAYIFCIKYTTTEELMCDFSVFLYLLSFFLGLTFRNGSRHFFSFSTRGFILWRHHSCFSPRLFRSECVSFILINLCGRTVLGCKKRNIICHRVFSFFSFILLLFYFRPLRSLFRYFSIYVYLLF